MEFLIPFGVVALAGLFVGTKSFKIVGQAEVMVIERLGRFHRLARSGFNILIPFIERPKSIDVRYFEADVSGVKRIAAGSTTRIVRLQIGEPVPEPASLGLAAIGLMAVAWARRTR